MDPLSVTLAVVSLATAVKDLVELGQKIQESFSKVSNNFRNAQRTAEDIKEMVEEIEAFCTDHRDVLANMKDFHMGLQSLLDKFRSFETSILPLLPQTGGRRRNYLIRGWDAWRNNNKVERSILDLQSEVVKVMRRHIIKSTMRTEVKLETIRQETSRGLGVLEVVQRDVSALRTTTANTAMHCLHESSGATNDDFNRNVIMFATSTPSTSTTMLRHPNVITEELMTTAYIKLQVDSIVTTLGKMSNLPVPAPNSIASNSIEKFSLVPILGHASMSITHLRHHVVREVTVIRDILETERMHTISIHDGANALTKLSTGLHTLGMGHESIVVSDWAITLARMLVGTTGGDQLHFEADLATYLLHQSARYSDSDDKVQSLRVIEEAHSIAQNLRRQCPDIHFQILYSDVLLQYAKLVDNQQSIKMSVEAIQILEDILNVCAFAWSKSCETIERVVQCTPSFIDRLFSSTSPITAVLSYAQALQRLGTFMFVGGHPESALGLALLAVAVRRAMVSFHGREYKVQLARTLSLLVLSRIGYLIPTEERGSMAEECIQLLRELAEKNPPSYARKLVYALWAKGMILEDLDRSAEAVATWEEAANLAGQIVQDSELCAMALGHLSDQFRNLERHDDAARTGTLAITTYQEGAETRALRYLYLSNDLQQLRRYNESADAAQASVTLYRRLAMKDTGTYMSHLTVALATLAHCLAASGHGSEALIPWKESMSILDNVLNTNPADAGPADFDKYLSALCICPFFGSILEDEKECLRVCSSVVRCLHRLSEIYPENTKVVMVLLWAEFRYAYNMFRDGHLQDAWQHVDHGIDKWSRKAEVVQISESEIGQWCATTILLKADILEAQGCTEQALLLTQNVHHTVKQSISSYQPCSKGMIDSILHAARLHISLGNSDEAIQLGEAALRLAGDSKQDPSQNSLALSLLAVASAALSHGSYERAAEAARKGCHIYTSPEELKHWKNRKEEQEIFIRPSLLAVLSSAEANLGRYSAAMEYACRAVDASLEIRNMKLYISASTAERSYMETRGYLADIFLAMGDFAQARQICEERKAYFSKRVEKFMGDYRELAPVLRMLGVLCCRQGNHEDGEEAAKTLSRDMGMLHITFPSLWEQVQHRLRNQAKVSILKTLEDMSQNLGCTHQADVVSLL